MTVAKVGLLGAPRIAASRLGVVFLPQPDIAVASRQLEFVAGRAASHRALPEDTTFAGRCGTIVSV
jgi:4'-phosphopantetheinyl transferase EntD